ncbi:MAG TPA: phosphatase PAP2 family protein [Polyangia bacterium]|nr:phosphatase PAP2 family protein [Polyangia bacterium]
MNVLMAALLVAVAGQDDATPTAPAPVPQPLPEEWTPPAKPPPREVYGVHLAIDIPLIVVGGAAGLGRILFENKLVHKDCPCSPDGINRLDRWTVRYHSEAASIAADVTVYSVLSALPLVDLLAVGFGRAWGEDLVVYVEALAVDTALQNATNFIVARPRPRTYAGDPAFVGSGEGYLSFYAGHVSTAFAGLAVAAYTIRKRYGEQVWPWIVGALIASGVAVERVASGHHFPTDVGVAAVVGTGIGIGVPWLHLRRWETHVQIAPVGAHGLGLAGTF